MTAGTLEVPDLADLFGLSIGVEELDEPGVVVVTAWANDGATVRMTWDEIACSVTVQWHEGDRELVRMERESASKVSIREQRGRFEFLIRSQVSGLEGRLTVRIGEHVHVEDALLVT